MSTTELPKPLRYDSDAAYEIDRLTAERDALRVDAQRYQWLTAGLDTAHGRVKRNEILERMSVMSYSAACMAIDAAMKGTQ